MFSRPGSVIADVVIHYKISTAEDISDEELNTLTKNMIQKSMDNKLKGSLVWDKTSKCSNINI